MTTYYEEAGYLHLMRDVLEGGVDVPNERTGIDCRKLYNVTLEFDLKNGETFPVGTVRPTPFKQAFEEGWFFLNGRTDTKLLEEKGVMYWKGNTSREFLDSRCLYDLEEGVMGKAYGFQLRSFGGGGDSIGVDQLRLVHNQLQHDPYSRRHLITYWNPQQNHLKALTECFHSHQYYVHPNEDGEGEDTINLTLLSRSSDLLFGLFPNVTYYSFYLLCMANLLGKKAGKLSVFITDAHIYHNQIEYVEEVVGRSVGVPPIVTLKKNLTSLGDMLNLEWHDFNIVGLQVNKEPMKTPRPPMAV